MLYVASRRVTWQRPGCRRRELGRSSGGVAGEGQRGGLYADFRKVTMPTLDSDRPSRPIDVRSVQVTGRQEGRGNRPTDCPRPTIVPSEQATIMASRLQVFPLPHVLDSCIHTSQWSWLGANFSDSLAAPRRANYSRNVTCDLSCNSTTPSHDSSSSELRLRIHLDPPIQHRSYQGCRSYCETPASILCTNHSHRTKVRSAAVHSD